ncbi:PBP1A family penicillin-binding protein [Neobacillus sp. PS3-34]|uniref:transglycosylase domain-containing protein n=1 Tax=Neobacillus sp. PS3-34 TaxID=3070678 RepID=UPI0027E13E1C|nr:PBP1A family penicillin-binding protein [Neobacillus sp. PS3-34]WML48584.1 PBP1A family penicillin-binding protein [Neobacillus sp. PS3-34]
MTNNFFKTLLLFFSISTLLAGCSTSELVNEINLDDTKLQFESNTIIYDQDNHEIQRLSANQNRELVSLKELPEYLKMAFVVTEDKRFYEHNGVDPKGIFRALYNNIKSGTKKEGASTITQQLARNVYLSSEKTLARKSKEVIIAAELERKYTKDQILEMYLNYIYLGSGAYGMQAAAQEYFGKDAKDLTIAEAALLAGLPKAPSTYSPRHNLELAKERRGVVLSLMRENKIISAQEEKEANGQEIILSQETFKKHSPYQAYIDFAAKEAADGLKISLEQLYHGGYHIYTNLDIHVQKSMNAAVSNYYFQEDERDQSVEVGMTSVDPKTGAVTALYGGRNYIYQDLNHSTTLYQPGSVIKPLAVYAPALETGLWKPDSLIKDEPMSFGDYSPHNAGGSYHGYVTLAEALARSLNIPAVSLLQEIGVNTGFQFVENAGITLDPNDRNLSLALGGLTKGVSTLEMAQAYGAFANNGVMIDAHAVRNITDRDGTSLLTVNPPAKKIMSAETAQEMTEMLQGVISKPYGTGKAANIGRPVAGKTGTTQLNINGIDGNKDAWFTGYTDHLVTSIHIGFDRTDKNHYITSGGGKTPAELFHWLMRDQ